MLRCHVTRALWHGATAAARYAFFCARFEMASRDMIAIDDAAITLAASYAAAYDDAASTLLAR